MSKRKAASAAKKDRRPKVTAKAQRANHDVVRSAKDVRGHSVTKPSNESAPKLQHEAPLPSTGMKESESIARNIVPTKGFDFSSASATVRAYQGNLLEMAQANMQSALELAQKLAMIKSPHEFGIVFAEFTGKQMAMFQTYSFKMVEIVTSRR